MATRKDASKKAPGAPARVTPDTAAETPAADEYDIPWKEAIESAFPEFMAFYFPAAHDAIDWAKRHEFLDKELHQVVRDAASGKNIEEIERKAQMKYVTSVERLAIERGHSTGRLEGKLETLTRLLTRRFGPLPEWVAQRLSAGTGEQLDAWFDRVLDAVNLAEVFGGH